MKREWEIGRCIHNIYEPERALPGYMGTGEGVVTENGNFVGAYVTNTAYLKVPASITLLTRKGLECMLALLVSWCPQCNLKGAACVLLAVCSDAYLCQCMHLQSTLG